VGARRHWSGARDEGNLWHFDKPARSDLHPTMKPVALVERAIVNSSRRGGRVLDPFGGSGTTLVAAERTGRRAALVEVDARYVDVIVRRWTGLANGLSAGRIARLEATGQSFDEVAAERRPAAVAESTA
jgi:DNA modification methylase